MSRVFSIQPHIAVNASYGNTSDVIIRFFSCDKMYSSYDCLLTKFHNRFLLWFAGFACKNRNKWYVQPPELLCNFFVIYIYIYIHTHTHTHTYMYTYIHTRK